MGFRLNDESSSSLRALEVKRQVDRRRPDSEEKAHVVLLLMCGRWTCVHHQATVTESISFQQNAGEVKREHRVSDCYSVSMTRDQTVVLCLKASNEKQV